MAWAFNCQAQKLKPDELKGKWQRKHTTPGLASIIHTSPVYIFARIRPLYITMQKVFKTPDSLYKPYTSTRHLGKCQNYTYDHIL